MNEVDLSNTLLHCPDRDYNLRPAIACFKCEFYNGIQRATERGECIPGTEVDFYQIICGRPYTRKLMKVLTK